MALNDTLDQMDLTDIHIHNLSTQSKIHILFNAHGTFSKTDHMIGHKTSLNKFKKLEIMSSIFLDHNSLKLETNLKEKTQKHSYIWKLNNMLLNNEWFNNEIKEEKCLETNENEHTTTKTYGTQQTQY